ncbi:MAG TPA: phage holin family protein [Vicinamibacterales bacterium]|nr:phage holin family protein [Vicinamibacterales bacterium]
MQILARLLINAAALWVAIQFVPGISFRGEWPFLLAVSLVFGALNVVVRPVLKFLTFPFFIVTLGLFTFVLNAIMLWLTAVVSNALGLGFDVNGFRAAFVGALLVTVVSFVLSLFVKSSDDDRKNRST